MEVGEPELRNELCSGPTHQAIVETPSPPGGDFPTRASSARVRVHAHAANYEAGHTCFVELEGRSPGSPEQFRMVDIFTVDTVELLKRLAIYLR